MEREEIVMEVQNRLGQVKRKSVMYLPSDYPSFLKHSYNAARFFSLNPMTQALISVMIDFGKSGSEGEGPAIP
jgi:hypothetical protein